MTGQRGMHTVRVRVVELLDHLPLAGALDRWTLFAGYITHALADRELAIDQGHATRELSPRASVSRRSRRHRRRAGDRIPSREQCVGITLAPTNHQ